jgi:hypothetical protein
MKLLKLVRKHSLSDTDERTAYFHCHNFLTIDEHCRYSNVVNHFDGMTIKEQIRFLSNPDNRKTLYSAYSKMNRNLDR